MYRKLQNTSKIVISSLIFLILFTSSTVPIIANFSEDFSDDTLDSWETYGKIWPDTFIDANWTVEDGGLVSSGVLESYMRLNYACVKTDVDIGSWEYRLFGPQSRWRLGFQISQFPTLGEDGNYSEPRANFQVVTSAGVAPDGGIAEPHIVSDHHNPEVGYVYTRLDRYNPSDEQLRGWHTYRIERQERLNFKVYIDDELILEPILLEGALVEYNTICMWTELGSQIKIDKISADPFEEQPQTFNPFLWGGVFLAAVIGVGYPSARYFQKKRAGRVSKVKMTNRNIINQVSKEFDLSNSSIATMVTGLYRIDEKYKDQKFKKLIPQELLTYRYLMHPIRLTIMKLLDTEHKMRSVEIKHILDLTWGEYGNHIKSLEEKGYVELVDEFNEDGHVAQTVYIKEIGRKEFEELVKLLHKFISNYTPINAILNDDFSFKDRELYPEG